MPKMDSCTSMDFLLISRFFYPLTRQAASLLLICALGLFASAAFALQLPKFPDPNLRSCVVNQIRANGWHLVEDVDELVCVNRGITNLSGLSGLPRLRSVDFSENRISDLSPLTEGSLPWTLTELRLADNRIKDIGYLFAYDHFNLLDLSGNSSIDFGMLRPIIEQNSLLTRLRLRGIRIAPEEDLSFVNPVTKQPLPLVELDVSKTGIDRLEGVDSYSGLEILNASGNGRLDVYALGVGSLPQTLRELYLADNLFMGSSSLNLYHNLTVLDLSGDRDLSFEALRPTIEQNSGLTHLRLRGISIGPLENLSFVNTATGRPLPLVELDVSETGISRLEGVETYGGLEILNASGNELFDTPELSRSDLPLTLRELYLANNMIMGALPLERYHNLTTLDLSGNSHIEFGRIRPMIEQNAGLTRLRLRGIPMGFSRSLLFANPTTGQPLPLVELDVSETGISSLYRVDAYSRLKILNASGNRLLDQYFSYLPPTLRELYLADTGIYDTHLMKSWHNLTVLDLSENRHIDFSSLRPIVEQNPGLTRLRLRGIPLASSESLFFSSPDTGLPLPLIELDVSETGIQQLFDVEAYEGLEILNASGNFLLDLYYLNLPPTLRELYLAETKIYDTSLLERFHNLTVLDLSKNRHINFSSLRPIIEQNSRLAHLRLRGIPLAASENLLFYGADTGVPLPLAELDVSETGIQQLVGVEAYVGLEILNASGNPRLDLNELSSQANLRELYLADTGIIGVPPLANYTHLSALDLSGNHQIDFSRLQPIIIQNRLLRRLSLADIAINAPDVLLFFDSASGMPLPLHELDLSRTGIQSLTGIDAYGNLQSLRFEGNGVTDVRPLGFFSGLRELSLSGNSGIDFMQLQPIIVQNRMLRSVGLADIAISMPDVAFFFDSVTGMALPLLELDLSRTGIQSLSGIDLHSDLQSLRFEGNGLTDVSPLSSLGALTELSLSGNGDIDFAQLWPIINQNHKLRHLGLADIAINSSGVPPFYNRDTGMLFALTELDLSRTGLESLMGISYYEDLQVLAASGNGLTSLDPLDFIALYSPDQLKRLDLSANRLEHILPLLNMTGLSQVDLRETTTLPCDQLDQLGRQLEPGGLLRPASCVVGSRPDLMLGESLDGLMGYEGELVTLSALATDPEDGDLSDLIEWSSNQGVIGTGAALEYRLLLGDQTITARVTDSDGRSISDSVSITVQPNHTPEVTIIKPVSGLTIIEGTAVDLSAEAQDVEDGPLSDVIIWSSDIQGELGSGGNILATLSVGTHTLSATVSDSRGKQAVATTAVTVQFNNPPVISVTSPINGASFIEGETIAFTAAATDIEDGDMSSNIEWYAQGVLIGTGSSFSPNLAVGVHDVQAKVTDNNGKSALVEFQVAVIFNNPPQLSVESPSRGIVTEQYLPVHLAATANDVESGDLSAHIAWSSDISGSLGTGDQLDITLSVGYIR